MDGDYDARPHFPQDVSMSNLLIILHAGLVNLSRRVGLAIICPLRKFGDAEEFVHLLKADTLGLWNEEPNENSHEPAESTEQEEHAL